MDKLKLQGILSDLYALDPSLRADEAKLVNIIESIASNRPNLEINEKFMNELKDQLMQKASTVTQPSFSWALKLSYVASGMALAMVLMAPAAYWMNNHPMTTNLMLDNKIANKLSLNQLTNQSSFSVNKIAGRAFGQLNQNIQNSAPVGKGGPVVAMSARSNMGGVSSFSAENTSAKMATPVADQKMIAQPNFVYKYSYKGDGLKLEAGQTAVLRRVKNISFDPGSALDKAGLSQVNLSNFKSMKVSSFNLIEDIDFGLSVSVNMDDGSISIGQNWSKWQNTAISKCKDDKCYADLRIKIENYPKDEELLALSDNFMNDRGVNKENLGQAELDNRWRKDYDNAADKSSAWVPDMATIVYPLKIDGKDVYDEWGNKTGVTVNIDIREMKISGMWGLTSQSYESSDYEKQDDMTKVTKMIEQGGMYRNYYMNGDNVKETIVDLGEPQMVYMKINRYENNDNQELIVPAALFTVKESPKPGLYYQNNVVVPLIKDFYVDEQNNGAITPLMRGGEAGSVDTAPATEAKTLLK